MSYSVGVYVVERTYHDVGNPTYNLAPMFTEALGYRLRELHGKRAGDVLPDVQRAVRRMLDYPEVFLALNPPNGWGTAEGALNFLRALETECAAVPDGEVSVQ